jgi:PPOX class probable F420-dependent enzyme
MPGTVPAVPVPAEPGVPPAAEARDRFAASPVARLGTVDIDGRPHLVPCCFVLHGDVVYSAVDAKPKRSPHLQRLVNVQAHPDTTLLVDHYEDNWQRLWWVRARGHGRVLDEGDEAARARALLAAKYPQYRLRPPEGPVLAVDITEWRAWQAW